VGSQLSEPKPGRAKADAGEAGAREALDVKVSKPRAKVSKPRAKVSKPRAKVSKAGPNVGKARAVPPRTGLPARTEPVEAADRKEALGAARRAVELAADKKASDIALLEVAALTTVADYFVICSGSSERQLGAIGDGIVEGLKADGVRLLSREGRPGSHWLLLDFGALIVHIMAPPERDYYPIERLWSEAPTLLRVQ
jgi:ribosome-associated protein